MNVRILFVALGLVTTVFVSCQTKTGSVELTSEVDTISYYIGLSIGYNLTASPMEEFNTDALFMGLDAVISGKDTTTDMDRLNMVVGDYMRKLEYAEYQQNLKEGQEFLARNKERKGIQTTESGLQYEILEKGDGLQPSETDEVTVHYHGTLIDGRVFDSSVERDEPATFPLNRVIAGWTEGLQLMNVGSKYRFYIPTELAYGMRPRQGGIIEPNMALIFDVELLSISDSSQENEQK